MELRHQLTPHLTKLRLSGILQTLEARDRQAVDGHWSYIEFLARLLEDEVERRGQRQLALRLRRATVNSTKTLETFDFAFNPTIQRQQVLQLGSCDFVRQKRNVLICGPTGTANLNQHNTPIGTTFTPDQTVTVVDPRHPLCGRTLPLVGIAQKPYLGRCCVVWIRPTVERHVPVSATDLEFDPNELSPIPLSTASVRQLLHVFAQVSRASKGGEADGTQPGSTVVGPARRTAAQPDCASPSVDQLEPEPTELTAADRGAHLPGSTTTGSRDAGGRP